MSVMEDIRDQLAGINPVFFITAMEDIRDVIDAASLMESVAK